MTSVVPISSLVWCTSDDKFRHRIFCCRFSHLHEINVLLGSAAKCDRLRQPPCTSQQKDRVCVCVFVCCCMCACVCVNVNVVDSDNRHVSICISEWANTGGSNIQKRSKEEFWKPSPGQESYLSYYFSLLFLNYIFLNYIFQLAFM